LEFIGFLIKDELRTVTAAIASFVILRLVYLGRESRRAYSFFRADREQ
jgi:hypothetical protein